MRSKILAIPAALALVLAPAAAFAQSAAPGASGEEISPPVTDTTFSVDGEVAGNCVGKGGCAYYLTLLGPGVPDGPIIVELVPEGDALAPSAALPATLASGRYAVEASSWAVSDAIVDGQRALVQRDASCADTFEITGELAFTVTAVFDTGTCMFAYSATES